MSIGSIIKLSKACVSGTWASARSARFRAQTRAQGVNESEELPKRTVHRVPPELPGSRR
ncbi:hypothetical protein Tsubulata_013396 [Turnera subulata]|uniref:Uncharacterized protein n=1 Tax=Turnera subulata TaxID=218843 RepID=A0A9Q0J3F4_9ROSI|nr:hypothetical protein Tsubulata_013396 [Turnera subulata]